MSYCRAGPDSDVYVIGNMDGKWECCGCPESKLYCVSGREAICGDCFLFDTIEGIVNHLLGHRKRGLKVPQRAINRLLSEIKRPRARLGPKRVKKGVDPEDRWERVCNVCGRTIFNGIDGCPWCKPGDMKLPNTFAIAHCDCCRRGQCESLTQMTTFPAVRMQDGRYRDPWVCGECIEEFGIEPRKMQDLSARLNERGE